MGVTCYHGNMDLPLSELARWRRTLLQSIKRQIREILGPRPTQIQRYYQAYRRVFRHVKYSHISKQEVLERVKGFPLIYLGDFHTLPRSQRSHVEVLKSLLETWSHPSIVMEMFASYDQPHLDAYLSGKSTEEVFLEAIRYQQSWGFQWSNYRCILKLAREKGLKVYGMNVKQNASLEQRDDHFSRVIASQVRHSEGQPVVVIVGDLHCSPTHLPARVNARFDDPPASVTLYQNSETIYLKEMDAGKSDVLEAVSLGKDQYCIFNTPPWVKMESYLNWLLNSTELLERELGGEERDIGDLLDYDNQINLLVKNLALLFKVPPISLEEIHFSAMDDLDFLVQLLNVPNAYPYFHLLQDHHSFYVPGEEILYLPALNINSAAAEITRALLCRHHDFQYLHVYRSGYFYRRVLYLAVGFFATRMINPLFRLEAPHEIREKLSREGDRRSTTKLTYLRRGSRLAGLFWDFILGEEGRPPYDSAEANRRDAEQGYHVSTLLAKYVTRGMVNAFDGGRLSIEEIRKAFPAPDIREADALKIIREVARFSPEAE